MKFIIINFENTNNSEIKSIVFSSKLNNYFFMIFVSKCLKSIIDKRDLSFNKIVDGLC